MLTTPDFLNEFDDDITASESIPYIQVQNPKNLSLSEIRQYNVPWGIFVPNDQAELVDLTVPEHFLPTQLIRGRKGSYLPLLPVRTVHETFTSYGSRQLVPCHGYC